MTNKIKMNIREWLIKDRLVTRRLSLSEYASLLDISVQYLCDIEHGRKRIGVKLANKIARRLNECPMSFVLASLQELCDRNNLNFRVSLMIGRKQ